MRVLLPTPQDGNFLEALNQIKSWNLVVIPYDLPGRESCIKQDFWLGSSCDGRTWALAVVPHGIYESFDPGEVAVAILLHPPKQNDDTIAEILLRIYIAGQNVDQLSTSVIGEILAAVPFPEYRQVGSYLPEAPEDWLQLPAKLDVSFTLSAGACVYGGLFKVYQRDSLEDVLRVVCGPRQDGILIAYTLAVQEVVPLLRWDVDWPLVRQGKQQPFKRDKVEGALPWESETDLSLLTLYQQVSGTNLWHAPPYYAKPVVRLRVGGRTPETAIANWYTCARVLRTMKQSISGNEILTEPAICESRYEYS